MKSIFAFLLLLMLIIPATSCLPQQADNESAQLDETDTGVKKGDKKKNLIEINEKFFIDLGMDLATVLIIITLIYYPNYRKMDHIFTFIIFNIVIFLLTFVLKYVKLSVGAAFGLFAVFSMLRYRTAGISIKDMTYLFIFIAVGLISAIQLEFYKLAVIQGVILVATYLLDGNFLIRREYSKCVRYGNIELIKPEKHPEMIEDLKTRTGLNIHRISIKRINFRRNTARIEIYYYK